MRRAAASARALAPAAVAAPSALRAAPKVPTTRALPSANRASAVTRATPRLSAGCAASRVSSPVTAHRDLTRLEAAAGAAAGRGARRVGDERHANSRDAPAVDRTALRIQLAGGVEVTEAGVPPPCTVTHERPRNGLWGREALCRLAPVPASELPGPITRTIEHVSKLTSEPSCGGE